jgi:glutathione S-transferase
MKKITLGYWKSRGRAQVPRLLMAYTGASWEEVAYTEPEKWFGKDKMALGLDFPNLPYLIDGNFNVTETSAICMYIIERSNKKETLMGSTSQERAKIINATGVIMDIMEEMHRMAYDKSPEMLRTKTWESTKPKLQQLSHFKGKKEWLFDRLTLADFMLSEMSFYIENMFPEGFKEFPFLMEVRIHFESLPEIKKYYSQPTAMKGPFTSPTMASMKF